MSSPSNTDKRFEGISYSKVTSDVVHTLTHTTWKYYVALGITFCAVLMGAGVYYYQSINGLGVWGTNEPVFWGLDIPNFIFWIGLSHSGTLLSAILLLTRSDWRKPIYRSAEALTFFALLTAATVLLTHLGRPWRFWYILPLPNYRFLWTNFRSALSWDVIAITSYMIMSGSFLYIGTIPDFAAARDNISGWRKKLYSVLALGWRGSDREWKNLHRVYYILACFLIPLAASVHSVVAWDWSVTIVPGFHSTIYAPYFVAGAIYSGIAGVIIVMIMLRKFYHFEEYIQIFHIDQLTKLVLVLSLLWTYINVIEIIIPWYKAENFEFMTLLAKTQGTWAPYYWTMILCNAVIPLALFSYKVRNNVVFALLISIGVEIGMYLERLLIIVPGLGTTQMPANFGSYTPSWVEISLFLWTFSIFTFFFLIFVKTFPSLSIYEVKELLRIPRRSDSAGHKEEKKLDKDKVLPVEEPIHVAEIDSLATKVISGNGDEPDVDGELPAEVKET